MTEPARQIKVLLIDDEKDLVDYLAKRLLVEGFMVRATFSGEEALRVASDEDFDVAVVDLKMPGIDGIETINRLRARRPFIQCIIITGYSSLETALECGKLEAVQYFSKPVEHGELATAIDEAANRKRELLYDQFRIELESVISGGASPHDIKEAVDHLHAKYGIK